MPSDLELDTDERLGVPRPGRAAPPLPAPPVADEPAELRAFDSELGRPVQSAPDAEPLSDADRRRLRLLEEDQARRELDEAEELLNSDPTLVRLAKGVSGTLLFALVSVVVGTVGVVMLSQALNVLAQIGQLPPWGQYGALGLLGLCVALVAASFVRLAVLYARLKRNRQLDLGGLAELHRRTRLRWLAVAKTQEARSRIAEYALRFPIRTPHEQRRFLALGATADELRRLAAARDALNDPAQLASSAQWFERFQLEFQSTLDRVAEGRIHHWANRSMVVTAVSPNALIDGVATLYFGLALTRELCAVYNLRAGRAASAVLLGRVFVNAYLAGQLHDFESVIEGQTDQAVEHAFSAVGIGVGTGVAGQVLGKVGARAAAGYLNRLMLFRLGRSVARLLRPVASPGRRPTMA